MPSWRSLLGEPILENGSWRVLGECVLVLWLKNVTNCNKASLGEVLYTYTYYYCSGCVGNRRYYLLGERKMDERENWANVIALTKALRRQGHNKISYTRYGTSQTLGIVIEKISWYTFDASRLQRSFDRMKVKGILVWAVDVESRESYNLRVRVWIRYD